MNRIPHDPIPSSMPISQAEPGTPPVTLRGQRNQRGQRALRGRRNRLLLLAVALPVLLSMALLAACGRDRAPGGEDEARRPFWQRGGEPVVTIVEDPLVRYQPALKAENLDELDAVTRAPRYDLDVQLDVISRTLTGSGEIWVPNNSREPWNQILFRLYPNLQHYGGDMTVHNVTLDGLPGNFTYQDEYTSLRIQLPRPLLPGDAVTVRLTWKLLWPSWVDASNVYALFGKSQEMTSLPLFYPSLAVFEQGATVGSGRWWTSMGTVRGDAAYNDTSLFRVQADLPSDQVPVTSGSLVLTNTLTPTMTEYTWVTGPSREFLLHMSPRFLSASEEAFGTRVTSYWLPGEDAAGMAALRYAVGSLRAFSDLYGDYPFRDMRVAPAPLGFRGMEYPQAMLLGVELYNRMRPNLEVLVAHEMAHQWWYQMVHNDPVAEPWLDEAIAEYSVRLYMEELSGSDRAELFQYQRWEIPNDTLAKRGNDTTISGPVESFTNGNQYETIVYGKGALFFDELRQQLGDRQFRRFVQTYLNGHRWGRVNDDDFLSALHVVGKPELVQLYREWVGDDMVQAASAPATPPATGN
jgi:hypothetical protein